MTTRINRVHLVCHTTSHTHSYAFVYGPVIFMADVNMYFVLIVEEFKRKLLSAATLQSEEATLLRKKWQELPSDPSPLIAGSLGVYFATSSVLYACLYYINCHRQESDSHIRRHREGETVLRRRNGITEERFALACALVESQSDIVWYQWSPTYQLARVTETEYSWLLLRLCL